LRRLLHRQRRFLLEVVVLGVLVLCRILQIIEQQLQLLQRRIHPLGGATEAPALQSRNLRHQLRDHRIATDQQALQRLDVIGKCRVRHARKCKATRAFVHAST